MGDYLKLKFVMLSRRMRHWGLNPFVGYPLAVLLFVGVCKLTFDRAGEYAPYIIVIVCVMFQMMLCDKDRADFLLSIFGDKGKTKVRIAENLIVALPFVITLGITGHFVFLGCTIILSVAMALIVSRQNLSFVIPTPFSKRPFEFSTGFRRTFGYFLLAYALTAIAASVGNLNLGLFSMGVVGLLTLTFYAKPEPEYYVWIYAKTPSAFLWTKLLTAAKNTSLMIAPSAVLLLVAFWSDFRLGLIVWILALLPTMCGVVIKYATFPDEAGIVEAFLLLGSIMFPPLALVIIPYYYMRSVNQLKRYLND